MFKKILFITSLILLISCKSELKSQLNFKWLIGSWERVDDQVGRKTFEKWNPTMDGIYIGHGYTLKDRDTVFQEYLTIKPTSILSKENDTPWILEVTGVNEQPTIFNIEKYDDSSFTAVNLENEFPTHIEYSIINDSLKARVYNTNHEIIFTFKKL